MPIDVRFAEMTFTLADLLTADEVFLTSSLRLVQPVELVSDSTFTIPGEMTSTLTALVHTLMERNDD